MSITLKRYIHQTRGIAFLSTSQLNSHSDKYNITIYYVEVSVLLGITPLVTFTRNYIRDRSGVISISSLVSISMTPFSALRLNVFLSI